MYIPRQKICINPVSMLVAGQPPHTTVHAGLQWAVRLPTELQVACDASYCNRLWRLLPERIVAVLASGLARVLVQMSKISANSGEASLGLLSELIFAVSQPGVEELDDADDD